MKTRYDRMKKSNTAIIQPVSLINSILDALLPYQQSSSVLRNVVLAITGTLAIWVSAKIQIPFYPVPLTMQTLVILLIGMAYGWRLGGATVLLYLAEGAAGLSVFAGTPEKGLGLGYMLGPTGGYLLGFFFAALALGYLSQRGWDKKIWKTALAMTLGTGIIYAFGLLWLGILLGWDKPILALGLKPFLFAAVLKIALAALLMPWLWKLIGKHPER